MKSPEDILNKLIAQYKSAREFARTIDEDPSDIFYWRKGERRITPRAVINIVKHHPTVKPHELNPTVFPKGLTFKFKD